MFQSRISPPRARQDAGSASTSLRRRDARPAATPDTAAAAVERTLAGFEAARTFFVDCFVGADPSRETLFVAYLDRAAHCIHLSRHDGGEGGVDWPLRSIMLEAARCNCAGLIVAHNHPSGDPTPSPSDRDATRRLATVGEALDVTLVDHLIFAADECTSLRRLGLI
ncbi:MAG: JAB domain-containing protein [Sphingomicrobium sp.]